MKSKSILIIHREEGARREMHRILSHFDFNLIYAGDGLHGLHAAKFHKPDLILSDIDIAVLNGLDMMKMLRSDEETQKLPVIFLHNELDFQYVKSARALDAEAFLVKPYLDNSLIYAIKRALNTSDLCVNKDRIPLRFEDCRTQQLAKVKYA